MCVSVCVCVYKREREKRFAMMLVVDESEWGVYENLVYYYFNISVGLKFFKIKKELKLSEKGYPIIFFHIET